MAGFGTSIGRPIYGRGPSPGLRFTVYAILSLTLMHLDQRAQLVRAHPLRSRGGRVPGAGRGQFAARRLALDDRQLLDAQHAARPEHRNCTPRSRSCSWPCCASSALEQENAQLRELQAALPPLIKKWLVAEVIGVDSGTLRQRLIINKGKHHGVQLNEPVVDGSGILGQVAHVGPWSSEVILITDPEHAIPVQVARNGLRTIAVGSGNTDELLLPYLAANSDVKSGDLADQFGAGRRVPCRLPGRAHHRRAPRGQPAARAGARRTAGQGRSRRAR